MVPAPPLTPAMLEDLCSHLQGRLCSYAEGLVHDRTAADDIVQTVFIGAFRKMRDAKSPFLLKDDNEARRKWLFRETTWRARDYLRARGRHPWVSLDAGEYERTQPERFFAPHRYEDRIAEGEALSQALAIIPRRYAACILLTVVEGFSIAELVEIMGFPSYATANKTLQRAMWRLREAYFSSNGGSGEQVSR